jgi:hypothetical protein
VTQSFTPQRLHLYSNQRDCAVKKVDDIEEASRDLFSYQRGAVFVLRIPFSLNVPILNRSDNVGLVGSAELHFDFRVLGGIRG